MASSISNSFPGWKTTGIYLLGVVLWSTVSVSKADLNENGNASAEKEIDAIWQQPSGLPSQNQPAPK